MQKLGEYVDQIFSKWTIDKNDLLLNLQEALNRIRPTLWCRNVCSCGSKVPGLRAQ